MSVKEKTGAVGAAAPSREIHQGHCITPKTVSQLARLCAEVSQGTPDAFFHYSPHVPDVTVYCCLSGWRHNTDWDYYATIYDDTPELLASAIEMLEGLLHDR